MAKKIILFLSDLKAGAEDGSYACPDGDTVTGRQTNVAPVKWVLRRNPEIREILCIVTPMARSTAWDHFCKAIHEEAPDATPILIEYNEEDDFTRTALPRILGQTEKGDEIWLEVTGGFRSINMYLMLVSRVLSFCGIHTVGAVYSNFIAHRIEDASSIIRMFDLVGGMQELTGTGSVETLRDYYSREPADPLIDGLIEAMDNLTESITLCRTRQITGNMERFGRALEAARACENPLTRQLLSAFRDTFGEEMTVPGLIRWYVSNDRLQQALTVYTEEMPRYIFERGDLLVMDPSVPLLKGNDYEDPLALQFLRDFLMLSRKKASEDRLKEYIRTHGAEVERAARGGSIAPPYELAPGIDNLLTILRTAFPPGGGMDVDWDRKLTGDYARLRELYTPLKGCFSIRAMLSRAATLNKNQTGVLLGRTSGQYQVLTIQHMDDLLPGSGYEAKCPLDRLAEICRDYLYVKTLRNVTNHANDDITEKQKDVIRYLTGFDGYVHPRDVTRRDIRRFLLRAMERLEPGPGERN